MADWLLAAPPRLPAQRVARFRRHDTTRHDAPSRIRPSIRPSPPIPTGGGLLHARFVSLRDLGTAVLLVPPVYRSTGPIAEASHLL